MPETFASYTVHADSSADARRLRQANESSFFERQEHASPLRLALLVVIVIAVLGGATALMDDGGAPQPAPAAKGSSR